MGSSRPSGTLQASTSGGVPRLLLPALEVFTKKSPTVPEAESCPGHEWCGRQEFSGGRGGRWTESVRGDQHARRELAFPTDGRANGQSSPVKWRQRRLDLNSMKPVVTFCQKTTFFAAVDLHLGRQGRGASSVTSAEEMGPWNVPTDVAGKHRPQETAALPHPSIWTGAGGAEASETVSRMRRPLTGLLTSRSLHPDIIPTIHSSGGWGRSP